MHFSETTDLKAQNVLKESSQGDHYQVLIKKKQQSFVVIPDSLSSPLPPPPPPLSVHSAGCGRTGTVAAVDYAWQLLEGRVSEGLGSFLVKEKVESSLSRLAHEQVLVQMDTEVRKKKI